MQPIAQALILEDHAGVQYLRTAPGLWFTEVGSGDWRVWNELPHADCDDLEEAFAACLLPWQSSTWTLDSDGGLHPVSRQSYPARKPTMKPTRKPTKGRPRRQTAVDQPLYEAWQAGDTCAEIGARYGIPRSTVQSRIRRYAQAHGLPSRHLRPQRHQQLAAWAARRQAGATFREIAAEAGVSYQAVQQALRRPALVAYEE